MTKPLRLSILGLAACGLAAGWAMADDPPYTACGPLWNGCPTTSTACIAESGTCGGLQPNFSGYKCQSIAVGRCNPATSGTACDPTDSITVCVVTYYTGNEETACANTSCELPSNIPSRGACRNYSTNTSGL